MLDVSIGRSRRRRSNAQMYCSAMAPSCHLAVGNLGHLQPGEVPALNRFGLAYQLRAALAVANDYMHLGYLSLCRGPFFSGLPPRAGGSRLQWDMTGEHGVNSAVRVGSVRCRVGRYRGRRAPALCPLQTSMPHQPGGVCLELIPRLGGAGRQLLDSPPSAERLRAGGGFFGIA